MGRCTSCGAQLPGGARFCPSCGSAAEIGPPPAAEERKLATLLFADLAGSTALASGDDPERVRARMERFYEAMSAEIETAGGTVEKFAGDAVMAAFGVPAALEDHAERALHAALAMRRRLRELFGDELALRIGVNTGEIVVGKPREGSSFVSGDAVNVAARLEQAAGPGEILVGERTVGAVRGAFEFGEPTTVPAKGKPDGLPCRRLERALSLMRPRGVSGLHAVFVGRERELELLVASYARAAAESGPRLVTILGDAGVGKTRLVRELWQWLAAQEPQPLQRTGRCLPYGQIAYWALGEVLKEHLGILAGDSPESVRGRLGGREMLGLALGLDVAPDVHPLIVRDRFQDAWVDLLEELTAERPVALLVEDLHWAEEPLLDLLEHVLGRVRGPLLVLATARPELLESRPGFGRLAGETVMLEPLAPQVTDELLARLLGGEPPEPVRAVVAHAEGNPFFLEEALGSLIDQGLLDRQNGSWTMRELPSGFVVPDTVQAVVAARIDLLAPAEKQGLQAAAVIGRLFWSGPVYELCGELRPDLRVLEERDFIRRRLGSSIEGEREYAIKHAVTREVVYAGIPRAKRAHLHAAFAVWLQWFGGGRDELAPILAHHLAEAVRPEDADLAWAGDEAELERLREKAVVALRRAAALAVGRYEIEDALSYLHRALELEQHEEARSELWRDIGRANAFTYDGEAFWAAMQESLRICHDRRTCADTYAELVFQTAMRAAMWKRRPDRAEVDEWIARALELAEPDTPARAKALLAQACWRPEEADAPAAAALELADRLGDVELLSWAMEARSIAAFEHARYEEAAAWAARRAELLPQIGDPDHVADIYEVTTPTVIALGRFDEARALARRHVELSHRLSPHHRMHGIGLLVETEEGAGRWEAIEELTARVEEAVAENEATPCVRNARTLLVCAVAAEAAGERERARKLERSAEALGMEGYEFALTPPRLRLALLRGDLDEARHLLEHEPTRMFVFGAGAWAVRLDALVAVRDGDRVQAEAPPLLRPGTYVEPFALRALGIVHGDGSLLDRAQGRFEAMGLAWDAAQTAALVELGKAL